MEFTYEIIDEHGEILMLRNKRARYHFRRAILEEVKRKATAVAVKKEETKEEVVETHDDYRARIAQWFANKRRGATKPRPTRVGGDAGDHD